MMQMITFFLTIVEIQISITGYLPYTRYLYQVLMNSLLVTITEHRTEKLWFYVWKFRDEETFSLRNRLVSFIRRSKGRLILAHLKGLPARFSPLFEKAAINTKEQKLF